jgi:hypothetical protein
MILSWQHGLSAQSPEVIDLGATSLGPVRTTLTTTTPEKLEKEKKGPGNSFPGLPSPGYHPGPQGIALDR